MRSEAKIRRKHSSDPSTTPRFRAPAWERAGRTLRVRVPEAVTVQQVLRP